MSYVSTVLAVRTTIEQMVHNLDAQVDQLRAAATDLDNNVPSNARAVDTLTEAFRQLNHARACLVNAHGEISGTVPSFYTQERIR